MKASIELFDQIFRHKNGIRRYFSPGRVNLIGEHIDYNGGLVFPAAIQLGTYGAIRLREDRICRFYSLNFKSHGIISTDLGHLTFDADHHWANYPKGILHELIQRGYRIDRGFDLLIEGTLPPASGLSSSASVELLMTYMANDLYHLGMQRESMALLSQHVENHYIGMHCGIMDQLIIAKGEKDKALLMDTSTLKTTAVNARFENHTWLIINTHYPRQMTDSKYNERRKECDQALTALQKIKPIRYLCELTPEELTANHFVFTSETIYRRARHVISEQFRTHQAKLAMENKDVQAFGALLDQSHKSLKEDYEVTGYHLDILVDAAKKHGAVGARVTGAGFGGCAIALVPDHLVSSMIKHVDHIYQKETGLKASFYDVTFVDGVHEITQGS